MVDIWIVLVYDKKSQGKLSLSEISWRPLGKVLLFGLTQEMSEDFESFRNTNHLGQMEHVMAECNCADDKSDGKKYWAVVLGMTLGGDGSCKTFGSKWMAELYIKFIYPSGWICRVRKDAGFYVQIKDEE